jgi:hypothetical protein
MGIQAELAAGTAGRLPWAGRAGIIGSALSASARFEIARSWVAWALERVVEIGVVVAAEQRRMSGDLLRYDGVGHRVDLAHQALALRVRAGEGVPFGDGEADAGDARVGAFGLRSLLPEQLVDDALGPARVAGGDPERGEIAPLPHRRLRLVDLLGAVAHDLPAGGNDRGGVERASRGPVGIDQARLLGLAFLAANGGRGRRRSLSREGR